ncbi:MAG: TIGR04372 family glycosyltransferase, partial [bacterium]
EKHLPEGKWGYHDYRDSDINNYILAAERLAKLGHYAIRMGAAVKEKLDINNPNIIDYATKGRTDFLDIYLAAKCRFFICDTAGVYGLSAIFRRPIAWVNFIPLEHAPTWGKDHLFIPKKLWVRKEKRLLTFKEIIESKIGRALDNSLYEKAGIEVIENTAQEIRDLAVEMAERLNGERHQPQQDEELQLRFQRLFKPSELNGVFFSRIGAEFLRQNRELLK